MFGPEPVCRLTLNRVFSMIFMKTVDSSLDFYIKTIDFYIKFQVLCLRQERHIYRYERSIAMMCCKIPLPLLSDIDAEYMQ